MIDVSRHAAHCLSGAGAGPLFSARQAGEPDEEPDRKDREANERDFLQRAGSGQRESGLRQHGLVPLQPVAVRTTFMTSSKPRNARLMIAIPKMIFTPSKGLFSA
jgi:hypothetical protein